jgi:hypothetical protein
VLLSRHPKIRQLGEARFAEEYARRELVVFSQSAERTFAVRMVQRSDGACYRSRYNHHALAETATGERVTI